MTDGKPKLPGLPATYTEKDEEAQTLILTLEDKVTGIELQLLYTLFAGDGVIARSARFINRGGSAVSSLKAMSCAWTCRTVSTTGPVLRRLGERKAYEGAETGEGDPVCREYERTFVP